MLRVRIRRGLDIPIPGAPEQSLSEGREVSSVALLGDDYVGLRASLRVEEGQRVKLGQALFADRRHPEILFTAPGSGVVDRIERGERRALKAVVVRLDGAEQERFAAWPREQLVDLRRDQVRENLLASGLWTAFRTRPFSQVPAPDAVPHAIFVNATDSNPLAARPEVIVSAERQGFTDGLSVIPHLTEGPVYLCVEPDPDLPQGDPARVRVVSFAGPHPSGLVGTHIHHLDPVRAGKSVWQLGYQDVIAIGKLFVTGRMWVERAIALAGSAVQNPRLVRTRLGASTEDLVRDELQPSPCRVISGSVLSGRRASGWAGYAGRFHTQICAILESPPTPASRSDSLRLTQRWWGRSRSGVTRPGPMIPVPAFEELGPPGLLAAPLLRALVVGDTEAAVSLGALELDEEDLALCAFACPGRIEYGPLLRSALTRIAREK